MAALSAEDAATALTERVEARRVAASAALPPAQQARLGQFFTPERAAELIADMPRLPESVDAVRVLDPGAGVGSLAAALVARAMREHVRFRIEIVAIEIDEVTAGYLAATLADLTATAAHQGLEVITSTVLGDFVELSTSTQDRPAPLGGPFDIVIMNPPYHKLGVQSWHRQAMLTQGVECSNIYAAFLALGALALDDGGQLVAITPRSFANGPYFGQFRRFLLDRVVLDRLHVFESRSTVFSDTGVLQENVVFSATRSGHATEVVLSVSRGHVDELVERVVAYSDVVHPDDTQRFIRILAAETDTAIAQQFAAQPAQLQDLGVKVSTGKVVDFRARRHLRPHPGSGSVPLVYPGNLSSGEIDWPREIRKDQAFRVMSPADERKYLLPEGYYVAVKRFSAKEERRRVVAAVWDPAVYPGPVAFENHLNVFHDNGQGLSREIAIGLSYWLNSSLVDSFFRTFSGHTQVNATDLRTLRFPTRAALESLGKEQNVRLPEQGEIDAIVEALLERGSAAAA